MDNSLIDFHTALAASSDKDSIWSQLLDYTRERGIRYVHSWFGLFPDVTFNSTCPDWWMPHYLENDYLPDDTLANHCLTAHGLMRYGVDSHGRAPGAGERTTEILNFMHNEMDLGSGIGYPVFLPNGTRIGGINLCFSDTIEVQAELPAPIVLNSCWAATAAFTKLHALHTMGLADVQLTERERDCLLWLASGLRTKEIGDRLGISDPTVAFHVNNAKRKLAADTREQAVARAVVLGLITP